MFTDQEKMVITTPCLPLSRKPSVCNFGANSSNLSNCGEELTEEVGEAMVQNYGHFNLVHIAS